LSITSGTKGRISELQASLTALKKGYHVAEPIDTKPYDLLISKDGKEFQKAQIKTVLYREDRESFVLFAKKGKNKPYTLDEVDVFLAVYKSQVYLVPHTSQTEYWTKDLKKWKRLK